MRVLAIDVGSSSVKAAVLKGPAVPKTIGRAGFATVFDGTRAEVDPELILQAIRQALASLDRRAVDVVAMTSMSPSWLAIDRSGRAITPVVTHQDRRSLAEAREIESRVGKARHLRLAGNRPVPGGISSTTFAWFQKHHPGILRRATLVGHLSTFLLSRWCSQRVIDPSNASFTGLFTTTTLKGWNSTLCDAAGISASLLPEIREANQIAGGLNRAGARELGLMEGTPVLVGCLDTSAAMLLAGTRAGTMLNVVGTTDVLAMCVDRPVPEEGLLTRALGVGRKWMSVSTLASAGSTIDWLGRVFYPALNAEAFYRQLDRLLASPSVSDVQFDPYLAGSRTELDHLRGQISQLTLASTREDIIRAAVDSLARHSGARFEKIVKINRKKPIFPITVTGGAASSLLKIMRQYWPADLRFRLQYEMTLRGLYTLAALATKSS